jgi:hypothetical protein
MTDMGHTPFYLYLVESICQYLFIEQFRLQMDSVNKCNLRKYCYSFIIL